MYAFDDLSLIWKFATGDLARREWDMKPDRACEGAGLGGQLVPLYSPVPPSTIGRLHAKRYRKAYDEASSSQLVSGAVRRGRKRLTQRLERGWESASIVHLQGNEMSRISELRRFPTEESTRPSSALVFQE